MLYKILVITINLKQAKLKVFSRIWLQSYEVFLIPASFFQNIWYFYAHFFRFDAPAIVRIILFCNFAISIMITLH